MLRIGGTGTALGGMKVLGAAFSKLHPDVAVVVLPSLGSGGGIKACVAGKLDIAVAARPPKDKEMVAGLAHAAYGRTPIAFATRLDNPADDVTLSELHEVYSGTKTRWPDGSFVRLIMRPAGESDTKLLRGMSADLDRVVPEAMRRNDVYVALNDQDNAQALETVPGSLGLTTLSQTIAEKRKVHLLSYEGTAASLKTMADGTYPYSKELHFVVTARRQPIVQDFLAFVASAGGEEILRQVGIAADDVSALL